MTTDYDKGTKGSTALIYCTMPLKFASLMWGVYAVSRDKVNLTSVITAGALYLCAEVWQGIGEGSIATIRFSKLEKALTKDKK